MFEILTRDMREGLPTLARASGSYRQRRGVPADIFVPSAQSCAPLQGLQSKSRSVPGFWNIAWDRRSHMISVNFAVASVMTCEIRASGDFSENRKATSGEFW